MFGFSIFSLNLHQPPYPPGLSLLQGGALGLDGVFDNATGPSREVHGDQGILRYTPLLRGTVGVGGGRGYTRVIGGGG